MDNSSQAEEEEEFSSLSQGSDKMASQNESKLNELSQMMFDLKEEMIRLQHKNSCKFNRVQDMVQGLSDTVKAQEQAAKEAKPSPTHYTNSQQRKGQGTRATSQTRSLPPRSPPPMSPPPSQSLPAMPPPPPRSLPPMSPPPLSSWPSMPLGPMPPRSFQQSPRSYSHGDPRRMPRYRRPDPANGNILKAALRVVNELDFDDLRYLKRHLRSQLSD